MQEVGNEKTVLEANKAFKSGKLVSLDQQPEEQFSDKSEVKTYKSE